MSWRFALGVCASLAAAGGIYFAGFRAGDHARLAKVDAVELAQAKADATANQALGQVAAQVGVRTEVAVERARANTHIIRELVPIYVTPAADARCVVPVGFVRLHDAAAQNRPPARPAEPVDAPSGVALSAVADTVAANYGDCTVWRLRLIGWQDWYLGSRAALGLPPLPDSGGDETPIW